MGKGCNTCTELSCPAHSSPQGNNAHGHDDPSEANRADSKTCIHDVRLPLLLLRTLVWRYWEILRRPENNASRAEGKAKPQWHCLSPKYSSVPSYLHPWSFLLYDPINSLFTWASLITFSVTWMLPGSNCYNSSCDFPSWSISPSFEFYYFSFGPACETGGECEII